MKSRTRWLLGTLVAALIAALVALSLRETPVAVSAASVQRGLLQVRITEDGETRLRERHVVAAPVSGLMTDIPFEVGDLIEKGASITRIYPAPENARSTRIERAQASAAEARLRQVAAQVKELQARIAQQERDLERSRELLASGAISRREQEDQELALITLRNQLDAAEATVLAAKADLRAARAAVGGVTPEASGEPVEVLSPASGRILAVMEEHPRVIMAGTPLTAIGDSAALEAVIDVLSEDAVRIAPGDPVQIIDWGGEQMLHGAVRVVEPQAFTRVSTLGVEEQRVHVIADIKDAPPKLGAGYRLRAHVVTWSGENVLTLPTSALFQKQGTWHVFAIEDGRAVLTPVQIGHRAAESAEVLTGLAEGDRVILFPSDELTNDTLVAAEP